MSPFTSNRWFHFPSASYPKSDASDSYKEHRTGRRQRSPEPCLLIDSKPFFFFFNFGNLRRKAGTQSLGPGKSVACPVSWPPANSSHRNTWGNAQEGSIGYTKARGTATRATLRQRQSGLSWDGRQEEGRGAQMKFLLSKSWEKRRRRKKRKLYCSNWARQKAWNMKQKNLKSVHVLISQQRSPASPQATSVSGQPKRHMKKSQGG